jgi:hypothetical protein
MVDRIRVRNVTTYDIGLKAQNGIEYNIKPGLFQTMARDDVEYNMAMAPKLFANPAQLVVEDEQLNEMMGIDLTDREICNKETAEKYLKGSAAKLRTWLEENNYPHVLEIVYQTATGMDLAASKIKVLQEFMPTRNLMEE